MTTADQSDTSKQFMRYLRRGHSHITTVHCTSLPLQFLNFVAPFGAVARILVQKRAAAFRRSLFHEQCTNYVTEIGKCI